MTPDNTHVASAPADQLRYAPDLVWPHHDTGYLGQSVRYDRPRCQRNGALFISALPGAALYIYVASFFVFQVPTLGGMDIAVPTVAGLLFLIVEGLRRFGDRNGAAGWSRIPIVTIVVSLVYLGLAMANYTWTLGHPRFTITYFALFATTLATAYALQGPERAWRVSWVLAIGSGVVSLFNIYETVTGQYNLFGVFPSHSHRAYGFADPNFTAAILVTMLPFTAALLVTARHARGRIIPAGLLLLSLVGICMTDSRGGIIGCVITFAAMSIFGPFVPRRRSSSRTSKQRGVVSGMSRTGLVVILMVSALLASYMAPKVLWQRLSTYNQWSTPKDGSRLQYWGDYIGKWRESPWIGQGPGYIIAIGEETHNTPLQNLVDMGVFGFAGFLVLNGVALWESVSARRRLALIGNSRMSAISGAVACALVGFHSTGFFLHCATHRELWFLIGFAAALTEMSRSNLRTPGALVRRS